MHSAIILAKGAGTWNIETEEIEDGAEADQEKHAVDRKARAVRVPFAMTVTMTVTIMTFLIRMLLLYLLVFSNTVYIASYS